MKIEELKAFFAKLNDFCEVDDSGEEGQLSVHFENGYTDTFLLVDFKEDGEIEMISMESI